MGRDQEGNQSFMNTDYFKHPYSAKKKNKKSNYTLDLSGQQRANKEIPMDHELRLAALRRKYYKNKE
ncbi:MAG: hypothetical protein P8Y70_17535 [Candidatus Lokiarchaeota archaeon]